MRRFFVIALTLVAVGTLGQSCPPPITPDQLGSYAVGRTTFEVIDPARDDRTLPVDVWYPAVDDGATPASVYDLVLASIVSDLALDNPPVAEGAFPLIIFSHGSGGIRFQSIFLVEHLASHGFIVAAPDHVGNSAGDIFLPSPPPFETRDRPLDVSLLISRMLERSVDPADAFYLAVDPFKIGVMGHSFGGFTTVAMVSGFEDVPPDLRVSSILPIAPAVGGLSDEQLASVNVPMLVLSGTLDNVVPIDPSTIRLFEQASGRRWRIDVDKAGHNSFTDICLFAEVLLDAGLPPELLEFLLGSVEQGCGPDLIPIEEAQEITKLYATAFFHAKLARNVGYRSFLTRGYVDRSGIPVFYFKSPPKL